MPIYTPPSSGGSGGGGTPDDNSVTSAKIADGAITNADINAAAAIVLSKLATDPLARANHTGTQALSTISDAGSLAALSAVASAQITDGTIVGGDLSGTIAIPSAATVTTQTAADNSTKAASTAYVDAKERGLLFGKAGAIGATETNAADFPCIVPFSVTMKRMKVVLASPASGAMAVQLRKAAAPGTAVPSYSDVNGFVATFANGSQVATVTPGTALTAAEGDLLNFSASTGSGNSMSIEVVAT